MHVKYTYACIWPEFDHSKKEKENECDTKQKTTYFIISTYLISNSKINFSWVR